MKIYIAGSFATEQDRTTLEHMIALVRFKNPNAEIFVPMEHKIDGAWRMSNPAWAKEVFKTDRVAMEDSTCVIATYTGHRSTTGTAWELGYAYATGLPITLYIPEWAKDRDFSMMVLNSASSWMVEDGEIHPITFDWLNQFNQK